MKNFKTPLLTLGILLLIGLGIYKKLEEGEIAPEWFADNPAAIDVYQPDKLQKVIDKLAGLESTGDPTKINPKAINFLDRDGTASFGCLQFKITSLRTYGIKYGFFGEKVSWDWIATKLFDCELQKQVARQMILDSTVDKYREWPTIWPKVVNELK